MLRGQILHEQCKCARGMYPHCPISSVSERISASLLKTLREAVDGHDGFSFWHTSFVCAEVLRRHTEMSTREYRGSVFKCGRRISHIVFDKKRGDILEV
jgi:hypothetical protein